jgi:hypothetical protein
MSSGATRSQIDLIGIDASTAFAFAAYGGDFYSFDGPISHAGVSTCAPSEPPPA